MNNTQHIGRLVKAPRFTNTGDKARANFTLAVDGYNDTTSYIPITCFGKLAENVAEYTDKGHLVAVEGRISSGKYTNDQGETVYTLDVIATNVKFLKAPRSATTTPETVDTDQDVPTEGEVA
jgi:single-strand DNA-binding protein